MSFFQEVGCPGASAETLGAYVEKDERMTTKYGYSLDKWEQAKKEMRAILV